MVDIILASSSETRYTLLKRLLTKFRCEDPAIDESQNMGEQPRDLSLRLSREKSMKIARTEPEAIVIGSDQVAICDGRILNKPGSIEEAAGQLKWQLGKKTDFYTGLHLSKNTGLQNLSSVTKSSVYYHDKSIISDRNIDIYVKREKPINCAGGAKFETVGVSFIKHFESSDPTAILGLPLMALCSHFIEWGIHPLDLK
ncbi:MAG: septum formation protein Maf [Betaproteobacteria bacterium TMED82]|nr:MAG: septum formation protein Maf [Betaproteobacteria bacterium TMED82]|tara:strand:- start:9134 stop:9730 length:597 start_codon:yes stop_codon:yes gene_type:complete